MTETPRDQAVAIVGMECLFPRAGSLTDYWANLREGVDGVREVPAASHWDPADYFDEDKARPDFTYARRGGFLDPVDFDPLAFGISPRDLDAIDTSQLLGLVVAARALADAGYGEGGRPFDRERCGVILGVTGTLEAVIPLGARLGHPIWRKALAGAGVDPDTAEDVVRRIGEGYVGWQENSFPGLLGNVVAGRIANRLDLRGTNCVVDAACASSLSAVHLALMELRSGRTDMVLTGGIDTFNDIFMYMCFSKTPALSPTGDARPFAEAGDGTILGEGLGMLVLKRLADAERDGDRVYAVIRGMGTSSDGKGGAVYAPDAAGQQRALRAAYRDADVDPGSIELLEAHGTGTKVGDATELSGLTGVFRDARADGTWCALGSVKSMLGHTKAAAGAAGLIKAALACHHRVLPPTLKVERPQQAAAPGATPFYVNTTKRPWLPLAGHPRRAGVSAFGFGGSNFHCVVEEYDGQRDAVDWDGRVQLLVFAADGRAELEAALEAFEPGDDWPALRRAAARARAAADLSHPCRLALVVERDGAPVDELLALARQTLERRGIDGAWSLPQGVWFGHGPAQGGVAALFPGQGAQAVGMLADLTCQFPELRDGLARAEVARGEVQPRLTELIHPHPAFDEATQAEQEAALRATDVAQPALGAVCAGAWTLLRRFGVEVDATAGHSFGELVALHAAGRLTEPDLHRLAQVRGRLMAAGDGDRGAMVAVLADAATVEDLLARHGLDLVVANRNAPRQVVLSGSSSAVDRALALCEQQGLTARRLAVSAAFHSPLVEEAAKPFGDALSAVDVHPGEVVVFANSTGAAYPADDTDARALLARQLARPVEFVRLVEGLAGAGVSTFVEVGPGRRLTGLVEQILEGREGLAALSLDGGNGRHGVTDLARLLAALVARGHGVDLSRWDEGQLLEEPVPTRRSFTVPLTGANLKPAPAAGSGDGPSAGTTAPAASTRPAAAGGSAPTTPTAAAAPTAASPTAPSPAAAQPAAPQPQACGPVAARHASPAAAASPTPAAVAPPAPARPTPAPAPVTPARSAGLPPSVTQPPESNMSSPPNVDPTVLAQVLAARQESLAALVRLQEQTAELHRRFLEGQERVAQAIAGQGQALLGGLPTAGPALPQGAAPAALPGAAVPGLPPAAVQPPVATPLPSAAPTPAAPPAPAAAVPPTPPVTPAPAAPSPLPSAAEAAPTAGTPVPAAEAGAVAGVLLSIVADKTGYPEEMLELSMGLDADLGIDSIKRVEILSAVQEALPDAPVVKPEHLGELKTLEQLAGFLAGGQGPAASAPSPVPATSGAPVTSGTAAAAAAEAGAVAGVLLSIVADKTGYPEEMLELSMGLDADLGIDSIKRVEILSAVQEALPDAPVVKPEHLGELKTLEALAAFLAGGSSTPAGPSAPAPVATEPATNGAAQPLLAEPARAPTIQPAAGLDRRTLVLTDLPPVAPGPVPLRSGARVWITATDDGLSAALAARLTGLGLLAEEIDWSAPAEVPSDLAGLLLVASAGDLPADLAGRALALTAAAGPALRASADGGAALLLAVTRLDGRFGLGGLTGEPAGACLSGLVKSAGHEWPAVTCRVVDVDPALDDAASLAEQLLARALADGPVELGLDASGARTVELSAPVPVADGGGSPLLGEDDLVLLTGGARGVTAEAALALARAGGPRLVLVGRSPAPQDEPGWLAELEGESQVKAALARRGPGAPTPRELQEQWRAVSAGREIRATLSRLEDLGARAEYRALDVRDGAAVAALVDDLRREHGPVTGLVHGAGVLADKLIDDKTADDVDRVVGTKVEGLEHLLAALGDDPLKALVLFSSTTARFGRKGQSDYAMANELLNKRAQAEARRRPGCRVVAFNWGPWAGGMVDPSLAGLFADEGIVTIPLETGARLVLDELSAEGPVEVVVLGAGSEVPACPVVAWPAVARPAWEPVTRLNRPVSVSTHPVLADHVLDGKAVLPVALLVEWLGHAALHGNPGLRLQGLDDLRVFKGVQIDGRATHNLVLRAGKASRRDDGTFVVPVELVSDGEPAVLHAAASVVLAARLDGPPAALPVPELPAYERSLAEAYGEFLFHGDRLRGLATLDGCGEQGVVATCRCAPPPAEWMESPLRARWLAEPLALDGAFQLLILWCLQRHGNGSLPTRFASYRQFRPAFPEDGVRIEARVLEHDGQRVLADIDWLDAGGEVVARMTGYECVLAASLSEAFARNTLSLPEVRP